VVKTGRDEAVKLIEQSLRVADKFGAQPIRVQEVGVADRTLVVQFEVDSHEMTSVLGEIANVMGVLSGLDIPELFPALPIDHLGTRAFDVEGQVVMWVLSSLEAAGFVGRGQPIEWLNRSMVQENTPGYRRSQADRRVGQIETALRDLLHEHGSGHGGADYIEQLWDKSQVRDLAKAASKEGLSSDPRDLLEFTFLPQLVDAITQQHAWFDDGCIPDPVSFKSLMTRLNKVRRKVAHHRDITEGDLQTCRLVVATVLGPLGTAHPDLAEDFLVDRWEDEVSRIVAELQSAFDGLAVSDRGTVSETERRRQVIAAAEGQLHGVDAAIQGLMHLVVPPQRKSLHDATVAAMSKWRDALSDLSAGTKTPDITVAEAEATRDEYQSALADVREMRERIRAIRLGLET